MKKSTLRIPEDSHGLHARPASAFVRVAGTFPCEITVIKEDIEVNGKSIMGLMMLALGPGQEFEIQTNGFREEEAIESLIKLVQNNFQLS